MSIKETIKRALSKKETVKEEEPEVVVEVLLVEKVEGVKKGKKEACPNCENSGMTCSLCGFERA